MSPKRIAQAFAAIGLHPNRAKSMADMAQANPALAGRIAEALASGDEAALRRLAAESQWSVAPAAPSPAPQSTPKLEPPGKPSIEAQQQRIAAEQAALDAPVAPDQTYPQPDFQMDLPPSRAGDTLGDVPDAARAGMSEAEDVVPGSPTSGPPAAWASDPAAPGFQEPIDNLIARLGDSPVMPMETRPSGVPRGVWQAGENIPGSMDDILDDIDARRATQPPPPQADSPTRAPNGDMVYPDGSRVRPNELTWSQGEKWSPGEAPPAAAADEFTQRLADGRYPYAQPQGGSANSGVPPRDMPPPRMDDATPARDMPPPQTPDAPMDMPGSPEAPGRKPRMSRADMAKLGVAGGVIGAGIGGGFLIPGNESSPAGGSPPKAGPVPNIIKPPKPMSTADLAAQTRPPPSVTTPQSPRDQAMKMIDDLNARRRAAGGEVPDAPETMQKVNRLLAMSNEQSAAASRGDIPVQGNSPREQAQRILAQLNAMRRQAGGEVPQAGQMMAEVRRLQAMADQQANARRSG